MCLHACLEASRNGIAKLMLTFCHCIIPCFLSQISNCGRCIARAPRLFRKCFPCCGCGILQWDSGGDSQNREVYWTNWCLYCEALGLDPYLHGTPYQCQVRYLTGFAGKAREGYWGKARRIRSESVSGMLSAIGKEIALVYVYDPTRIRGYDKFVPRIQATLDGWANLDGVLLL